MTYTSILSSDMEKLRVNRNGRLQIKLRQSSLIACRNKLQTTTACLDMSSQELWTINCLIIQKERYVSSIDLPTSTLPNFVSIYYCTIRYVSSMWPIAEVVMWLTVDNECVKNQRTLWTWRTPEMIVALPHWGFRSPETWRSVRWVMFLKCFKRAWGLCI